MSIAIVPTSERDYLSGDDEARAWPQYGTRCGRKDVGSWPMERPRLLRDFREACAIWYAWRESPEVTARRMVYNALVHQHGGDAVLRWQHAIKAVLDRAEAEVKNGG